jgi:hypothetical protein
VADRVDTTVHEMKSPLIDPAIEGVPADARVEELPASNHAVLALGERGDRAVGASRLHLAAHCAANCIFGGHGEETGGSSDAVGTRFAADLRRAADGSVTTEA